MHYIFFCMTPVATLVAPVSPYSWSSSICCVSASLFKNQFLFHCLLTDTLPMCIAGQKQQTHATGYNSNITPVIKAFTVSLLMNHFTSSASKVRSAVFGPSCFIWIVSDTHSGGGGAGLMLSEELGCSLINDTFMNNQMVLVKIYWWA